MRESILQAAESADRERTAFFDAPLPLPFWWLPLLVLGVGFFLLLQCFSTFKVVEMLLWRAHAHPLFSAFLCPASALVIGAYSLFYFFRVSYPCSSLSDLEEAVVRGTFKAFTENPYVKKLGVFTTPALMEEEAMGAERRCARMLGVWGERICRAKLGRACLQRCIEAPAALQLMDEIAACGVPLPSGGEYEGTLPSSFTAQVEELLAKPVVEEGEGGWNGGGEGGEGDEGGGGSGGGGGCGGGGGNARGFKEEVANVLQDALDEHVKWQEGQDALAIEGIQRLMCGELPNWSGLNHHTTPPKLTLEWYKSKERGRAYEPSRLITDRGCGGGGEGGPSFNPPPPPPPAEMVRKQPRQGKRTVSDLLKEGGWVLVRQRNHLVYKRPLPTGGQQTATTSKTPSDYRASANAIADLHRKDLVRDGGGGGGHMD